MITMPEYHPVRCAFASDSRTTHSVYNVYMTANGYIDSSLGLSGIWQQSNCGLVIMYVSLHPGVRYSQRNLTVRSTKIDFLVATA